MRTVWRILFLATLLPLTAHAQAQNDHLIVPDRRIGPYQLGMSDKDLFKVGIPAETKPGGGSTAYFYENDTIKVFVDDGTHQVIFVEASGGSYHTSEGLRVGSSLPDVERAMGPPERLDAHPTINNVPPVDVVYNSGGLKFDFSIPGRGFLSRPPKDTVQSIAIQTDGAKMF